MTTTEHDETHEAEVDRSETPALSEEVLNDLEETETPAGLPELSDVTPLRSLNDTEDLSDLNVEFSVPRWQLDDDDDDDDAILSSDPVQPPPRRPPSRPGAITPMGVRADKGKGLLADSASDALLGDMDQAIAGLDSWRSRHKAEIDSLSKKYQAEMDAMSASADEDNTGEAYEKLAADMSAEVSANLSAELAALVSPARTMERAGEGVGRMLSDEELKLLRESMALSFTAPVRPTTAQQRELEGKHRLDNVEDDALLKEADDLLGELGGNEGGEVTDMEDKLVSWAGDLEAVLTKMDALSSGYQHEHLNLKTKPATSGI